MLDLAEIPASGNFELLYNDLDHSIYLYRMDADGNFQQVAGKDDNPYFPDGPIGNLGAGLGNNSNQYIWRYGEHNGELYIGTYDTSTLTYHSPRSPTVRWPIWTMPTSAAGPIC